MQRKGKVFADRYHARTLRTPTEVRSVLVNVYGNARKHAASIGERYPARWLDPCSSALWFDGWRVPPQRPPGDAPVFPADTWLLTKGWRERGGGPIGRQEAPKS